MNTKHDLFMFSTSPQPSSGFDDADEGMPSPQSIMIPCLPSEDDDITVTDAMRIPNANLLDLTYGESSLCEALGHHDSRPNRNFSIREVAMNPEPVTSLELISVIKGDGLSEAGKAEREVNHDYFHRDSSNKVPVYQNRGSRRVFCDGLDRVDLKDGRVENFDLRWTEFGPTNDELDYADRPGGAADCDDVAALRKSYNSLLEKHQRFILSYVQLHELKGGLENRVKELERELGETRLELEQEKLDKTMLADRVESLQKMVSIFKEKIPKLAPADNVTDNNADGPGEWTSSLKEELRQTMLLAVHQQKELNKLDKIIRQQNEAIKRLSHATVHSGNDQKTLSLHLNEHETSQRTPELLRLKPEGSSVLDPAEGRSKVRPSSGTTEKLLQKTFGSEFEKQNRPDEKLLTKPKDTTISTVSKPNLPPTSAKQAVLKVCGQTNDPQFRSVASGVKGPPTAGHHGIIPTSEHSVDKDFRHSVDKGYRNNVDPENSSFVFVDRNHVEIRICPLCNAEFLSDATTIDEFVEHVSVCNPPEDFRQCPMCSERFDDKETHSDFEAHVNRHFDEDHFQCLSPTDGK